MFHARWPRPRSVLHWPAATVDMGRSSYVPPRGVCDDWGTGHTEAIQAAAKLP